LELGIKGKGNMPLPALILEAAQAWGVPPWVVEEKCTAYWWRWYIAYRRALQSVESVPIGGERLL